MKASYGSRKLMLREMGAIYIMWVRHMKRYVRTRGRILGSVLQPTFFLIAFGLGIGKAVNLRGASSLATQFTVSYFDFLLCGVIGMTVIFTSIMGGISVIWDRRFGFLQEVFVAPVSRISVVLGRISGSMSVAILQSTIIFFIAKILGSEIPPYTIIKAFPFIIVLSVFATSIGLSIASKMEDIESFQFIMNILIMPVVFLSTAFIPLSTAPEWLKKVISLNPVSYAIDGIRHSMIKVGEFSPYVDATVITTAAVLTLLLSAAGFSRMEV